MDTPPASPPPPLPPPPANADASPSTLKRTRKATRLRSLATRPPGAERPVVNVDPATGKADGSYKKKLRTYLGIVARDKVDVTYDTWKEVPTAQKDLIWEDIQAEFQIPEASDNRTKKKILQIVGERWRQFKSDLTRKWALAVDKDGADDIVCEKYGISKEKWTQFCQTRRDPSWEDVRKKAQASQKQNTAPHVLSRGGYEYLEEKLMAEKAKKRLEEAAQSGSTEGIIDPPSPIRRHVKWKMARTKKTGQMTSEAAKEIADRIDSLDEQASQGSFVPHGRQDILTAAIGRPEHPGRVRAVGAGVTIKQYFGSASRTSRSSSSMPLEDLEQLTQQIRDQLEESITEKVTRKMMESFSQMQSQFQSRMQSQGIALPPEPEVGPSGPRVSTKESCVAPSGNNPGMGDSDKCGLYIEENPSRLVALGRLYEGSTTVHNIPLLHGQVKVGVEEVKDTEALVPVPTAEVTLVGQALNTFLAWPTHLVKRLSEQAAVSPAKPPESPDEEVDDPLYLMTLTIPQLFLKPLQVMWDATIFGVFNQNFPLYIKHEDLSEIAHGGQCLSISVIQLWILHLTETSVRAGNSDVYGFLEPHGHWQMVVILPKENLVVWFYSLHNRPDNYLKGIINSALKGLDDTPQPKSKAAARWIVVKCNRQKGITECGYYVMHWMSTIILGSFRNNWETYFNEVRPLEAERFKALRIQWAQYYLKDHGYSTYLASSSSCSSSCRRISISIYVEANKQGNMATSLATRSPGAERPVVNVDLATGKADGPHKKKLRTYLGIVARDKVDAEFEIPEASDSKTKKKILQTVNERSRNGHLQPTRTVWTTLSVKNTALARRNGPNFVKPAETPRGRMCGKRHRPSRSKTLPPTCCLVGLMNEKTKKRLEEAAQSGSTEGVIDPSSPIRRHVKWKMARTKKTGQMTSKATKEIAEKIDVLTTAIGRLEHPGRVRVAGAGVTIKQYFGSAPQTSRSSSSMPPEDLQQLTQQIRDQLEESIMQSQGLALPPEPEVGPSGCSCQHKGELWCSLMERSRERSRDELYEGSTTAHNIPLLHGQVKVGVEEVKDAEALVHVPTNEVTLVGQTLNTFLAWLTHLVKRLSEHAAVSPAKPPESSDDEVDDPLYLMTLTIPQLHLTETSLRVGNFDVYGFLEPQSIQRSGQSQFESESYIKSWMQSSK
ncbi:hypothetical protein HKD37_18G051350 [Glycine soja]